MISFSQMDDADNRVCRQVFAVLAIIASRSGKDKGNRNLVCV